MIKELIIKNFEAHERFRTKLDKHITTFTGATDAGKSSIIRAIKWLVMNRPLGDSYIRNPDKVAMVGIRTEKGTVTRKKGKGINQYKINGQTFEAFGTNVPEEVQQFLNMQELNFQFQFDAPYWFMISPAEVSKQLNQVVDLEIIDTTLSRLSGKVRNGKAEVKVSEERLEGIEAELGHLSFAKPMFGEYDEVERVESELIEAQEYYTALKADISDVERYTARYKSLRGAHSDGEKVAEIADEYLKLSREVDTFVRLLSNLEKSTAIADAEMPNLEPLLTLNRKRDENHRECNELLPIIKQLEIEKEEKCPREEKIKSLKRELKRLMGKACPLCGSALTKS